MEKQRWEEKKREDQKRERVRRKKMQLREKVEKYRKVAYHYIFPMICGPGWSKSRLAKAAGAEPAGQMRDEQLHAVLGRSKGRKSKCTKHHACADHFWKLRCRKSAHGCGAKHISKSKFTKHHTCWDHSVVARSAFPSQGVQNTPCSDYYWKLTWRKSARHCGATCILKSKV